MNQKSIKRWAWALLPLLTIFVFSSCSDKDDEPYLYVADIPISAEAQSWEQILDTNIDLNELHVTNTADWSWLQLRLESGQRGVIKLKFEANKNNGLTEREAHIYISSSVNSIETSFKVIQQPGTPSISFAGDGGDIDISSDTKEWSWKLDSNIHADELTAGSDVDWCVAKLTGSLADGLYLKVKVDKNESLSERNAVVTVNSTKYDTSVSFNITQQTGAPSIKFADNEGKDQKIAAPQKEWEWTMLSNVAYGDINVTSNESWCQVKLDNSSDAADMKAYKLTTTVAENPTDKSREAVVTISSTQHNLNTQYLVTQEAATFRLSHASVGYDRDGGNRTVTITSDASWQAVCDADWITLEQNGNYLTVRVKSTTADRSATITFKDKSNATITIRQSKYKVGDAFTGDNAGGTVVYIGDDRRIAAKKLSSTYRWCEGWAYTVVGCSSRTNGKSNTQKVHNQSSWRGNYPAFKAIDELGSEWYMPAVDEVNDLGSFASGVFWTSTEEAVATYIVYLSSGIDEKQNTHSVIAIREF